jgi:sortase A
MVVHIPLTKTGAKPGKKNNRPFIVLFGILLVSIALFLIFAPYFDEIRLFFDKAGDPTKGYKYVNNLIKTDNSGIDLSKLKPIPSDNNVLVIPAIGVDSEIIESQNDSALSLGVWHRPASSTPDKGGNTVLTAHRFLYLNGPNTFYHLNKLKIGDRFFVLWQGKEYDYEVSNTFEVGPTELWIEDNTDNAMITLYSCTYNAEKRYVVRGSLISP